jgi:hypothetical protein
MKSSLQRCRRRSPLRLRIMRRFNPPTQPSLLDGHEAKALRLRDGLCAALDA